MKKEIDHIAKTAGLKVKVVEKPGKKMVDYLKSFDKTRKSEKCNGEDCMTCKAEKSGNCRKPDIVYRIKCKECERKKLKSHYYGESNFNAYTRGKQHLENYRSNCETTQEKSAMRKHAKEVHGDKRVDFEMKVMKTFKGDPLGRQVYESILIIDSKNQDDFPMNSKNEFNQALIVTASYKQRHSE